MKVVSDNDAQNDKEIKGNKNVVKKPIQVLHISKKDNNSIKEETLDENQSLSEEKELFLQGIIYFYKFLID